MKITIEECNGKVYVRISPHGFEYEFDTVDEAIDELPNLMASIL